MRTIIAGGTGLIGRALAADIARSGQEVIILTRSPEKAGRLPDLVRAHGWDGQTERGWSHLIDADTVIVNLAGENLASSRWTPARKERIRTSRREPARAIVAAIAAAAARPRVLIQASAVGYYGSRGDERVSEDVPPGSDFPASVCVEWEGASAPVEALGVRRVIIRTGLVFSRKGGVLPLISRPFRFFVGGPLGSGRQRWPWIHIVDEVGAIRFLIDRADARGPFNLAAPDAPTNGELAQAIGRAIGRPAFVSVPAPVLHLVLGEVATMVLDGQRAVPSRLIELGYQFQYPELDTALGELLA